MKSTIQSVKGTREFYPEDMAIRNWMYRTMRRVSESFGYQEYDGPFLESFDLYVTKSGDDLVKENFAFPDRSGEMITLRPELTPSLARMVAQRQKQLAYPLRWWSFGPFWRYERPQKGRTREFFQWNIDLIGVNDPIADAEMVSVGAIFLRELGLTPDQVQILVNNRSLMDNELSYLSIPTDKRLSIYRLIDKKEKMSFNEWQTYAGEIGLTAGQFQGIQSLLDNKDLWKKSPSLERFFSAINSLGMGEWVRFAPHIIRGLDYYTGTVFEAWDRDGEFRSILGGGRYDNLVNDIGGDPLPAVGFAMGDVVMTLVLKKFGKIPTDTGVSPAKVLVTIFDEISKPDCLALAARLRAGGINVSCYPEPAKLSKQFKYGDRMGMRVGVVLGPDEVSNDLVTLKDLKSGIQKSIPIDSLIPTVKIILSEDNPTILND